MFRMIDTRSSLYGRTKPLQVFTAYDFITWKLVVEIRGASRRGMFRGIDLSVARTGPPDGVP